jgi:hypothetical protein
MYETYLMDAIEMVSSWNLGEDLFADAVNEQVRLMAGINNYDEQHRTH